MPILSHLLLPLLVALPGANPAPAIPADTTRPPSAPPPAADTQQVAAARAAPLPDSAPGWRLTFGGQLRTRAEAVSNYQLGTGADRRDVYGATRIVLGASAVAGPVQLDVQGRHATSHSRHLPGGGRRPNDHDVWDVQTASVQLRTMGDRLELRVGRQPVALGRERLVGASDWSNARRAFDGARTSARLGGAVVEGFYLRPVAVHPTALNRRDTTTALAGATVSTMDGRWQLYLLDYAQERATGTHRRHTLGARAVQRASRGQLGWDVEGAWQDGREGGQRVRAWFAATELTAALPGSWRPELAVGLDAASGDRAATAGRLERFHVPFASSHSHGGYVDIVGRPNALEARVVATTNPTARLQLRGAAHHFTRLHRDDAAYAKNGAALATSTAGSRAIGAELDATASYRVGRGLRVLAGYGYFAPGAYLRAAPAGARATQWGFAGTTFDF